MKIVFLQDDFPPHAIGGAGIVAASLARELVKQGHELTIITSVQDRALAGSFREGSMRIERIYSDYQRRWRSWLSLYNPATVGEIRRILAEVKPEIVHAHNVHYHLSYWALHLAKRGGAKVFLTAHDVMLFHYGKLTEFIDPGNLECRKDWNYKVNIWRQIREYRFWYNPLRNPTIRRLLKNVDRIFAVSSALKDALEKNGIKNIEVVHNGIDMNEWQVAPAIIEAFVQKHKLEERKVVLFGGRISGLKGGGVMLEALRDIVHSEPSAVLLLLGARDAYAEKLERQAREWGIGAHLISTGWLSGDELHAAYHAADVVVIPSLYLEPFGMIALEAMACGTPVIGSCLGGTVEIIVDGETGYLLNPYDITSLARRVVDLLRDKEKRDRFGRDGRARAAEYFSTDEWCRQTLSAYTAIR